MMASRDGRGRVLPLALALLYAAVVARTAWISDDAAITLRAVLNFAHGWGLNYNIAERVQAYTHPLWFALIALANGVLANVFAATFALSFLLAITAFLLATKTNHSTAWAAIGGLVLIGSKAFVDYSTSGLENPLAYVLLALFMRDAAAGLASLINLTRPDLGLIVAPLLLAALWRARRLAASGGPHTGRRAARYRLDGVRGRLLWLPVPEHGVRQARQWRGWLGLAAAGRNAAE